MTKQTQTVVAETEAQAFGVQEIEIEKAGKTYSIDFDNLPRVSQVRVIRYGLGQLLSDAAAPVATSTLIGGKRIPFKGNDLVKAQAAAIEAVDKRLADLSAGILRRVRESSIDPVESEARKIAIARVRDSESFKAFLAENALKPTDKDAVSELAERAAKVAQNPKVRALAQRRVDEMSELDIGDEEA